MNQEVFVNEVFLNAILESIQEDLNSISSLTLVEKSTRDCILSTPMLPCWKRLTKTTFYCFPWMNQFVREKSQYLGRDNFECQEFSAMNAVYISYFYHHITYADLLECVGFYLEDLQIFVQNCKELQYLRTPRNMLSNRQLSTNDVRFRDFLSSAVHLEKLHLSSSHGLGCLILDKLQHLNVTFTLPNSCNLLFDDILNCANLTEINVSTEFFFTEDKKMIVEKLSKLIEERPLRVDFTGRETTYPLKVTCGICSTALYDALQSFILTPGQQDHIRDEIHTFTPPIEKSVQQATLRWAQMDGNELSCKNGCHNDFDLYLIDCQSGMIENYGFAYSIACGPGNPQTRFRRSPPLGLYQAAGEELRHEGGILEEKLDAEDNRIF